MRNKDQPCINEIRGLKTTRLFLIDGQKMITKIISGGQTGADRGALDAAVYCEWPHGGWCPKERKAEDGIFSDEYQLHQMPSSEYFPCTKANVIDSDATVIFAYGPLTGGSLKTPTHAHHLKKPWHEVDLIHTTSKASDA